MDNLIKHIHHIIPKHVGGTDEESNLIELTIEEHANAHLKLYQQHGRLEDKLAWMGLSGQIGKDVILREIAMAQKGKKKPNGFGKKISIFRKSFKYSEQSKLKMSLAKKGKKLTQEHIDKTRRWGQKNSDYQKQRVSESLAKEYKLTDPNGKTFIIKNLRKYCIENNLDQGNMSRNLVRGWMCKKIA